MNNANIEAQGVFIGMLQVNPKLYDAVIIKPEYLIDIYYRALFVAMQKSMKEHSAFIAEKMLKTKDFNVDLYFKCADTVTSTSPSYFKQIQDVIIGDYKRFEIKVLSDRLYANELNLNDYSNLYMKISTIGMDQSTKINRDILEKSCTIAEDEISFVKFRRLGIALRMEQHDFMVLAAGTGVGKTGAAINFALDLSKEYKIIYFNMEMPEPRMYRRILSILTGISQDKIRKFESLEKEEKDKLYLAMDWVEKQDITMSHDNHSLQSIRSYLALHNSKKHMIVFVDHMGLIATNSRNSYEGTTDVAKALKRMSKEFNCTIIALSQLNRDALKKDKNKSGPELHMLRDSGEVEQSARKVMFVWEEKNSYEFVIRKNDSGAIGRIKITYDKPTQQMFESAYQR